MQRGTLEGKTWDRGGWDAGDTGEAREVEVGVRAAGRVRSWLAELTSCGPFEGRTRARSAGPHSEGLVMGEEGGSPASLSAASPPARPHLPPRPHLLSLKHPLPEQGAWSEPLTPDAAGTLPTRGGAESRWWTCGTCRSSSDRGEPTVLDRSSPWG